MQTDTDKEVHRAHIYALNALLCESEHARLQQFMQLMREQDKLASSDRLIATDLMDAPGLNDVRLSV